jgi:hypothetical protein
MQKVKESMEMEEIIDQRINKGRNPEDQKFNY